MTTLGITGYSDRISVQPGQTIQFYVHSERNESYRADIVRLIHGDTNPDGPGYKEEEIVTSVSGEYPGRHQAVHAGSYICVPHDARFDISSFTLMALVLPTTPTKGVQGIITKWSGPEETGYGLFIDDQGELAVRIGRGDGVVEQLSSGKPLFRKVWYLVAASFDAASGHMTLVQEPIVTSTNTGHGMRFIHPIEETRATVERSGSPQTPAPNDCPVLIAAATTRAHSGRHICGGHFSHVHSPIEIPEHEAKFNGRIERPAIANRVLNRAEIERVLQGPRPLPTELRPALVAAWDFAANIVPNASSTQVLDDSLHRLHGHCINMPSRGMPGHNWTADHMSFTAAPQEYGAIHFHDDAVDDARWEIDFALTVPEDLKSGVYAARLRLDGQDTPGSEDYIPFFVRPPAGRPTARIAVIIPTASYMAYANENLSADSQVAQLLTGRVPLMQPGDLLLQEKDGYGYGTYTVHSDGWGVHISSRLRPILNMRPKYTHVLSPSVWQLNADLHLTDWLEAMAFDFDVHTDEDLQREGVELLKQYRVVLTCHHPEYCSEEMLDAYEAYQQQGGRWLYLAANGFYWCTVFHPDNPALIEVRKGDNGTRAWTISPGEYCNAFDGKHGGLWRVRGRNMSKLTGVSFTSFGLTASSYYRRAPDSFRSECAWMFEGIGEDEPIGNFGLVGGGAAGLELDRYDLELGTPHNAFLLAHSEGHNDIFVTVSEESTFNARGYFAAGGTGDQNPYIRADIVYFKTPNDGAVFSASSMAWCGSLSHNNYDNNVSRLTANVIRGFLQDGPLP